MTEVVFVGEGPGVNEDRLGRPFVGRAGELLVRLLASIGWRREDVFITNIVKCRPPDNRDPEPDEVAACAPFLHRQLQAIDPALVVTLGRHSMNMFRPGRRSAARTEPPPPSTRRPGPRAPTSSRCTTLPAALRAAAIETASFEDVARVPVALEEARRSRDGSATIAPAAEPPDGGPALVDAPAHSPESDQLTLFT